MRKFKLVLILLLSTLIATSCVSIKPHERGYLLDDDMTLTNRPSSLFENNFQFYREGASGANGGSNGGGCGCN